MKIALVLTGHMRCWERVFPNTLERIIKPYNPDIFISTWETEGYWTPGDSGKSFHEKSPLLDVDKVLDAYHPITMDANLWENHGRQFYNQAYDEGLFDIPSYVRPVNTISMFYKIREGILAAVSHAILHGFRYDFIIRMRPDLILNQDINHLFEYEQNKKSFCTVVHRNHKGKGTGDMFHFGVPAYHLLFLSMRDYFDQLSRRMGFFCPHEMSVEWINYMGIPWQEISLNKTIMHTPNGEYKEFK